MQLKSIILAQLGLIAYVSADCCNTVKRNPNARYFPIPFGGPPPTLCADDSFGTPCCGNGKCNIFCCNCDDGMLFPPTVSFPLWLMWSGHFQGCRGGAAGKVKRDDTSPSAGAADSLFQGVDVDNQITLAEYIGWVSKMEGQDVAKNATLLTMWIEKFEA